MNRDELVRALSKSAAITHEHAALIIDNLSHVIIHHFEQGGEKVKIRGFGTFSLTRRPSYMTTHPKTGEPIQVESRYLINFKPSEDFRSRINR